MCGIAGIVRYGSDRPIDPQVLAEMARRQRHRGPDDSGLLVRGSVGLAHTRLSIIDLSPSGHQPFSDESGAFTIVYNGEIYNYKELRTWLETRGHRFSSRTDTEVVLRSYMELGPSCVEQLTGMFAFAIWDARRDVVFLARDRIGEKPLVYADHNGTFVFASEINAVLADPEIPRAPDRTALGNFLATGKYIPYPRTAFDHIKKVPPAHTLTVSRGGVAIRRYWCPDFGRKTRLSLEESADQLEQILDATVSSMMMSDVPIGLLLSGGVDSSSVAFGMRRHTDKMHTFACGDSETDEEFLRARAVASRLSTLHSEHIFSLDPESVLRILDLFGEPIFEGSIVYRMQMSEFIRSNGVTVLLTGDGGDEVFGGYASYSLLQRFPVIKRFLARVFTWKSPLRAFPGVREHLAPRVERHGIPVARALGSALARDLRDNLRLVGCTDPMAASGVDEIRDVMVSWLDAAGVQTLVDGALFADLMLMLHYNHVMIPDAVGMAQSLELRSPFLDRRLIEFAASLPAGHKVDRDPLRNKKILKLALARRLPGDLVYARKIGYGVNIQYLQRHMQYWSSLFKRVMSRGLALEMSLLDREALRPMDRWEPGASRSDLARRVSIVMLELWLDQVFGTGRFAQSVLGDFATPMASS